jgi:hypothetical protein
VGAAILKNPRAYAQSPAVQKLLDSAPDNGASLQVTDLEALAKFIAAETHKKHPDVVGGRNQLAVLRNGRVTAFEQQSFPPPPKPTAFSLIMDVPLRFGPGGGIVGPSGETTIWIRNTIVGYRGLVLDGNFFLGNEIRDSIVWYDGGPAAFDQSNTVIHSQLQFGEHFGSNFERARSLAHDFPWSRCLPFSCNNN